MKFIFFFSYEMQSKYIYYELRFPTGKVRAFSLETLSVPSGVLLKIKGDLYIVE